MDPDRLWILLNDLAAKLGVEVRLENLAHDEEYRTGGGLIRLGGSWLAIIDQSLGPAGRVRQLGLALVRTGEMDQVYLVPAVREFVDGLTTEPSD